MPIIQKSVCFILAMLCMAGVHEVLVTTDNVQVIEADKNLQNVQIKQGKCLSRCAARHRDLNASMEGDMTSTDNWFQIRIVAGSCR